MQLKRDFVGFQRLNLVIFDGDFMGDHRSVVGMSWEYHGVNV